MTHNQFAIFVPKVHSVALTITEIFTIGAFSGIHPSSVAIWLVAVFPNIYEIIRVDVALSQIATDTCTGRDGSVYHH